MASTESRTELLRSKRKYGFALTPLADAMFQLLIFFMLTSSLTPYSLLTLRSGPGEETAAQEEAAPPPDPGPPEDPAARWTIENGAVLASGQRYTFTELPGLAGALALRETPNVLVISTPRAQVQDIVTVLETLAAAQITSVQVVALVEN